MTRRLMWVLIALGILSGGCRAHQVEPSVMPTRASHETGSSSESLKALIIHGDRSMLREDAVAWQEMLKGYRIEGTVINGKAPTLPVSGMDLIIVGIGNSENPEIAKEISKSGLPVIGIDYNGYSVLRRLGLHSPEPQSSYLRGQPVSLALTDASSKYRTEPFSVDPNWLTFPNRMKDVSSYGPTPLFMEGILEDVNRPGCYSVVRCQQYVSWCCARNPGDMSEPARKLFANIVYVLVREEKGRTDAERVSALQELNYRYATEYYETFCVDKLDLRGLQSRMRDRKSVSSEEMRQYVHLMRLQTCTSDWTSESPDTVVSQADRAEVDRIVGRFYPDPAPQRKGQRVSVDFYGGKRCRVNIVYHNEGPLNASGYHCYLVKYQGKWVVMEESHWIS
jgi:hypothetical protein